VAAGQGAVDLGVVVHPLSRARGELANDSRGDPGGEHAIGDLHPRRHRRARGDQGVTADDRAVEHGRAVADQRLEADDRSVHHAQVPDRRSLADLGCRVPAPVQDGAVLDIRSAPHDDRAEVGPQHRPVPDRRVVLDAHVADQRGGRRDPRRRAHLGLMTLEREQWHPPIMPDPARSSLAGQEPRARSG